MYALVAVIFLACFLLVHRIIHSPFGQVVKAIRENEPRAISLGYKTEYYKWIVFILAATLAGIAGGLKAQVMGIETLPSDVGGPGGLGPRRPNGPVSWWHRQTNLRPSHRRAHRFIAHAILSGPVRRLGRRHPGRDLYRLRAGVPPRPDRRTGLPVEDRALRQSKSFKAKARNDGGWRSRMALAAA